MLHILLGKHYFAKQSYIDDLAAQQKAEVMRYTVDTLPRLASLVEPTLFSKPSVTVLDGCLGNGEVLAFVPTLVGARDVFVIVEEKVDKRKSDITKLLKLPGVMAKEFVVPQGPALVEWVMQHAQQLGGSIAKPTAQALVKLLGGEQTDPRFEIDIDIWSVHNELQKLITYANGKEIDVAMVRELVRDSAVPQVWDIIDAVGKRQPALVLTVMQKYLDSDAGTDDKAKVIQLNALLADQFRSLLLVKSAQRSGMPDDAILQSTKWKSGRLFMMKKLSTPFEEKSLVAMLAKLEALDVELKSSTLPPKVMIDLILSQV